MGPDRRRTAAASLADLFHSRSVRGVLGLILVASLAAHAGLLPLAGIGGRVDVDRLAAQESSYLRKVVQKHRARKVSRQVKDSITMPPAPPEPEAVVQRAMSESLTGDVAKITGELLNVDLQRQLTDYVRTSLADELAAAAKDIATGRLSEDEIKRLHRRFQAKAHETTVAWRKDYLRKHQIERAAMSTTQWYEADVSGTLVNNMTYELFHRPHNPGWWYFTRPMGRGHGRDAFIIAGRDFGNRLGLFALVPSGKRHVEEGPDASWPGPGLEQAQWLLNRLRELCDGTSRRYKHNYAPSWPLERLFGAYGQTYCPHRREEFDKIAAGLKAARAAAFAAAEAYVAKAGSGADAAALAAAQKACFDGFKAVGAAAGSVQKLALNKRDYDYAILNRAVKTEVLRGPAGSKAYRKWIGALVGGVAPLIRDFARGQFKKGIIVHTGGVDEAMKEFPKTVVPLVRRDMQRLIPERRFAEMCFEPYQHTSEVTQRPGPPSTQQVKRDAELIAAAEGPAAEYVKARRPIIAAQLERAIDALAEEMLERVLVGNLLFRSMGTFVEGVDYTDKVQEKLTARAMAMSGRGQDLAKLTADGVPDTSAPLVALFFGAPKGHGANLEPVQTVMRPAMLTDGAAAATAVQPAEPALPPAPAEWGFKEQATVKPTFNDSPRFEGIPFLTKFPRLDGDLSDWGTIRPLILRPQAGGERAVLVYAAWNYQGYFFGYQVTQDAERFYYPSLWRQTHNHNTGQIWYRKAEGIDWAYGGDYFRLMFDTLDARSPNRGHKHTQEFVIFPLGTESDPHTPGVERAIDSQRDAVRKQYRGVKARCVLFPHQPPPSDGPDGSGPYRVTVAGEKGYTTEVFIPRSLLKRPVFAPGWYVGFDCAVATGAQPRRGFRGQTWAHGEADSPDRWGDVLLLGTDPRIVVQQANATGNVVANLAVGRSYLLTVIDPDRNVSPASPDTVIISAEVLSGPAEGASGGAGHPAEGAAGDVEVYVLSETGGNTGVFRGYVNTQPGVGRQVQGVLEVMPLQRVRFGYVDFANAKGVRNVISEMTLPVIAPVTHVAQR